LGNGKNIFSLFAHFPKGKERDLSLPRWGGRPVRDPRGFLQIFFLFSRFFQINGLQYFSPGQIFLFPYKDSLETSGELTWILA